MTAFGILALVTALQPPAVHAESLYLNRHLGPGLLDSAWTLVADARAQSPADPALLALLAQMCVERGDRSVNTAGKLAWYDRAAAVADSLRIARPDLPAGHFWWATARGSAGRVRGVVNSLGLLGPIRAAFERSVELDSGFALGWYALGRLYLELPPVAGGSAAKAERFLRGALAADPHLTIARLGLAEALVRLGRKAEAREELGRVLGETAPSHPAEFVLSDRPAAEEMLRRMGRK
ncbi:MAG: tetratricopeptide repeat protein [bacterium]